MEVDSTNTDPKYWERLLTNLGLGMWVGTYRQKLTYQHQMSDIKWEILKRNEGRPFDYKPEGKQFNTRRGCGNNFYGKKHTDKAKARIKAARAKQVIPVKPVLCGHPDRKHYCQNKCRPCYRASLKASKEAIIDRQSPTET